MPFSWILPAASIASSLIGSNAAQSAADTQSQAANRASDTQQQIFNTINAQNAPWRQEGATALGQINDRLNTGTSGFNRPFAASDLPTYLAPNYDFQLQQGLGAVKNAGNLQSGLISGNTLKGVNDYAQNFAGNAYQNAFNNYNTNQSNIFNRLSTIAGFGSGANQVTANAGTAAGANIGNSQMAAGQAGAAGIVGSANALTGGLNNAASWYSLPQILNLGGGSAGNFTQAAASNPTNSYIYGTGSLSD